MSNIGSYTTRSFSETQKFLVLDPSTSTTSLVLGSDLVAHITPSLNSVKAETTRLSAENTDYEIGTVVQTTGETSVDDGQAGVFLVVEGGTGDFPMLNGNDLLVIGGDAFLREQLASDAPGDGASLVVRENGNTLEADAQAQDTAINNRVIRVGSVAEGFYQLSGTTDYQYSVIAWHPGGAAASSPSGGGVFVYKSDVAKSDHDGGYIISPTVPPVSAGSVSDFLDGVGETDASGFGCYVRVREGGPAKSEEYGLVGDGVVDDTATTQKALDMHKHVTVDAGHTPLITSTITIPSQTKLEMLGGHGNLPESLPSSYFIKDAAMTTDAVLISQRGHMYGGGVVCQSGNTGDGIKLGGNSARLSYSQVYAAGNDGVRVGYDGEYVNCNSHTLEYVKSYGNGRHGIYVHDGYSEVDASSDTNAGTLLHCQADNNGGDGIRMGRTWWETVINPLTQANGGWGMKVSDAIAGTDTVEECRYITIIGGDYNEGNTIGSLDFSGYQGCLYFASANQLVNRGGSLNNFYGSRGDVQLERLKLYSASNPAIRATTNSSGVFDAAVLENTAAASNGRGISLTLGAVAGRESAKISSSQLTTNLDGLDFYVNNSGAMSNLLSLAPSLPTPAVTPGTSDGDYWLGAPSRRWSEVYAVAGAINTSDEREKEQQRRVTEAESRVAKSIRSNMKAFKWSSAVEKKGDGARWHFGWMAQEIAEMFAAEGLDAHDYGMFCYDEWPETEEALDEDGNVLVEYRPAGNRYGLRYDEVMAFVIGCM